ncbi:hypothetical protein K4K49_003589 [Colletotrichum sp. SAR 10_70]|nr:hypothetical protein K4K50_002818 [Colletotrichum sp. SAR 10_71]KAI8172226.1 hypothetical protein K4K49_003589 [Colletotrichum sp. SAR 10_70]
MADIHNSDEFLCHKPLSSYTRNGQKISFCHRCKGIIVRTLVEFKFDPSSPASADSPGANNTSMQDWLWHLCDLRPYPELDKFRPGFEEMILHIGRELKKNGDEDDPVARAKAAPGGEWTADPVAAYRWWKAGCVRRAKERKGKAFVDGSGGSGGDREDGHRHDSSSVKDGHHTDAVPPPPPPPPPPQLLSSAAIHTLSQLRELGIQIAEASNKKREAVAAQAARDAAEVRLLACRKRVDQLQRRCSRSDGSPRPPVPELLVERVESASLALQEHEAKLAVVIPEAVASAAALAQSKALEHLVRVSGIGEKQ